MVTAVLGISRTPLQIQAKEVEKLTTPGWVALVRRTDVFYKSETANDITNEASWHITKDVLDLPKTVVTTPFRLIWGLKNVGSISMFYGQNLCKW